jgi:hypothetical protein
MWITHQEPHRVAPELQLPSNEATNAACRAGDYDHAVQSSDLMAPH